MKFWKKLHKLLRPFNKKILTILLITIFFESIRLIGPYLFKEVLDTLAVFKIEMLNYLLLLIGLMFAIYTIINIVDYYLDRSIFDLLLSIEKYLPIQSQKKLVSLPLGYHEKENTGSKIIKVQRGTDKLHSLLADLTFEVVPTVFQSFLTIMVMIWFDWQIAVVFSVAIPLFVIITYFGNKKLYPLRKKRHKQYENASGKMTQSVININTVKSFVQEKRETDEFEQIREDIFYHESKEWHSVLKLNFLRNLIINIGRVAVILFGIYKVSNGTISIGTLVFFATLSEKVYFSLFRISRTYDRIQEGSVAVERLTKLLEEKSNITNPTNGVKMNIKGKIKFDNVAFFYQNDSDKDSIPALQSVNLEINPGETVALVGPSGGGKSTVIKLLYRHYDLTNGQILIDDINIKNFDLNRYRSQLSIVPQEIEVFDTTIAQNIAYGKPDCTFEEIKKAAKIANADDFICKFANKYDTEVGERGIKLSGGQKQRIGIARAILNDPKILIFDEATSSLDSESEQLIQKSIDEIAKNRTMIVIAHRLSTIQNADKILVIKGGRLVEQGNHHNLIKKENGVYRQLVELQQMGEISLN